MEVNYDLMNYYAYDYDYNYGNEYLYIVYPFEKLVYLYIWEFLVIITLLVNIVVISVFLRRKMRNPTNVVLAIIAISDSLTGLVTLPTYIMVFLKQTNDDTANEYYYNYDQNNSTYEYEYNPANNHEPVDGYTLTKELCQAFMISKFFLSKSCHTMSIFLTLFLTIQRYIVIAFPFYAQRVMHLKLTAIICILIVLLSPIMHIYHLNRSHVNDKGMCHWEFEEADCGTGCIYMWVVFFIRHFIPCAALVTFTVLFIRQLRVGERTFRRINSSQNQIMRRSYENRRIAITVTAVVIVFLIPEIPYCIYLLYNAIDKSANEGKGTELEANRAIHMTYELLLVLSFHANFYIYTLIHRKFRKTLYETYIKPIRRLIGYPDGLPVSRTSSSTRRPSTKTTASTRKCSTQSRQKEIEMVPMVENEHRKNANDINEVETNLNDELDEQDADENNTYQKEEINERDDGEMKKNELQTDLDFF